jgi:hypothetical protein
MAPFTVANAATYANGSPLGSDWSQFREDRAIVLTYFPQICELIEEGVRLLDEAAQSYAPDKKDPAGEIFSPSRRLHHRYERRAA